MCAPTGRLEEQAAALLEANGATREKVVLLEQAHAQHNDLAKERKTSSETQATAWNALHATHTSQLQALTAQITTLEKELNKSDAALLAVTNLANTLQQTNINLATRLEQVESVERKEEESMAALRERIARLETLVEVLMKK